MKPHIFYDFDGTLGDSLLGHALFIQDTNERLSTGINFPSINDIEEWKKLIGMPMEAFLKNVGFPDALIPGILRDYEATFGGNPRYASTLFNGIPNMVKNLFEKGYYQSIVSSNFKSNFSPVLESSGIIHCFAYLIDRELLRKHHSESKAECLKAYSNRLKLSGQDSIYVGDAESDWEASSKAGMMFVGSSYGWQIRPGDKRFPTAHSPAHLERILLSLGE